MALIQTKTWLILTDNPNSIFAELCQRLGLKEGRKICIRIPIGKIRVPCCCLVKGFAGLVKSLKQYIDAA